MNQTNHGFRERLLKMEQVTPALKKRYDKEIQAMLEKELTGIHRWSWLVAAIMGAAFAVLFGTLAVMALAEFPWYCRLIFAAGALFGIAWAVLGIRVFRRGSVNLKIDTRASAGMAWGLPVIVLTLAMVGAPDSTAGLRMILSGLVFLVMGATFMIQYLIQQSELKTSEKLLEIEYRLAELTETLKSEKPSPSRSRA